MSLDRLTELEAAMDRHLKRWRYHDDIPYNSVRVKLQRWYKARYADIYRLWVEEINVTDNLLGKQWYHDDRLPRDHRDLMNDKRIYG